MCDVSSEKKGDVFFPARKAADERWGVVMCQVAVKRNGGNGEFFLQAKTT